MSETGNGDLIIWTDCETTGLENDAIMLELAIIVTDSRLKELWAHAWLLDPGYSLGHITGRIEPFVVEMHTKNNLWNDLQAALHEDRAHVPEDAANQAITLLQEAGIEARSVPLAGSSPHFDRRMLQHNNMKALDDFFHYRNMDVSSVKELAKRWAPTIYNNRPGQDEEAKKHRGLDDVRASIEELKFYVREGFIRPELFFAEDMG